MLQMFLPIFIYYGYLGFFNWPSDERAFLIAMLKLPNLFPKTAGLSYNSKPEPLWLLVCWPTAWS